jgi:putative transposase
MKSSPAPATKLWSITRISETAKPVGRDSVEPTNERCGRSNPATGVHTFGDNPAIAFLTVCTFQRQTGLADPAVHKALVQTWTAADEWLVGHYLIMPDHIHVFCAPHSDSFSIEQWVIYWKRQLRRACKSAPRFQSRGFHHRLRRAESYQEKVEYVWQNPVRVGLVKTAEEWEFKGVLNVLPWWQ